LLEPGSFLQQAVDQFWLDKHKARTNGLTDDDTQTPTREPPPTFATCLFVAKSLNSLTARRRGILSIRQTSRRTPHPTDNKTPLHSDSHSNRHSGIALVYLYGCQNSESSSVDESHNRRRLDMH
jgi:hypothetical protein